MIMRRLKYTFIVLAAVSLFTGCRDKIVCPGGPGCEPTEDSHTFIMYVVGNNNLYSLLRGNVNMAMAAVEAGLPEDTRVVVYWDGKTSYNGDVVTRLTEIVNEGGKAVEKVLKEYDDQNSADPEVMRNVLRDVRYFAPAEVYGITLLGHGTGWFPPELNNLKQPLGGENCPEHDLRLRENPETRAYGPDGDEYMSTQDLVTGLAVMDFDYIIFDVCFMSSVEFLYELRGNAPYIVASPAEVMGSGIPYHRMLPVLFDRDYTLKQRLVGAIDAVVDYYEATTATKNSAAFTLIDTDGLDDLADAVKGIFETDVRDADFGEIQSLEILQPEHAFFDLQDYMRNITLDGDAVAQEAYTRFERALAATVAYERHTKEIYSALGSGLFGGDYFPADRVCGIASYIPRDYLPVTRKAYYETPWAEYTQPGMGL